MLIPVFKSLLVLSFYDIVEIVSWLAAAEFAVVWDVALVLWEFWFLAPTFPDITAGDEEVNVVIDGAFASNSAIVGGFELLFVMGVVGDLEVSFGYWLGNRITSS